MRKNLDLYRNVSTFQENFNASQKVDLKMTEVDMLMSNVKERMIQLEKLIESQQEEKHITQDEMIEQTKKLHDEILFTQQETKKAIEELRSDIVTRGKQSEFQALKDEIHETYVTEEQLSDFSSNIEKAFDDFIVNNTPRGGQMADIIERVHNQIKEHSQKIDVLFDKLDRMNQKQGEFEKQLKTLSTKEETKVIPNENPFNHIRTAGAEATTETKEKKTLKPVPQLIIRKKN